MAKLYELLLKKIKNEKDPDQEDLIYNPLGVKCGSFINLDILDYRGHNFVVKSISESTYNSDNSHKIVDYELKAKVISGDDISCRLRLMEHDDPDDFLTHRVLLLSLYDYIPYDEGFEEIVRDDTGEFEITEDDNLVKFWRPNLSGNYDVFQPLLESWNADVKCLADEDRSGKVDEDEVKHKKVEAWDYSRQDTETEIEEYLFIEMDKDNGSFTIWRGKELDPQRVDSY